MPILPVEVIIQPIRKPPPPWSRASSPTNCAPTRISSLAWPPARPWNASIATSSACTRTEKLDFSLCRTFNLDEYVGLFPPDPNSYRYYMNHHLFRHVNIDPRNTYLPNGLATDLDEECRRYEATIQRFGGIDLQLLGIGKAGHIGFNEPLSALRSRTRVKALTPTTLKQNAALFGGEDNMPRRAITMGVGTILECRRCLLLATGDSKAEVIAKAVEGPITSMISATALQLHARCHRGRGRSRRRQPAEKDYYRWIFANEPEWEEYR